MSRPFEIFLVFLRLGLTSFGGPVAHLGYFHREFVSRRRWIDENAYADLVALCQFLPGPASSQVGMAIGLSRGGYLGALAAWSGFTLPSALFLTLCALGIANYPQALPSGLLHGLKIVAVAVVAQAVWAMSRMLCPDLPRTVLMLLCTALTLLLPMAWSAPLLILLAGLVGALALRAPPGGAGESLPVALPRRHGTVWLGLFAILLLGLPVLDSALDSPLLAQVDAFYRAGSLVFGGGHVVLPLLQAEVVQPGWIDPDTFLAGYGMAQAVPGPLFTFAAFLGASMQIGASGWSGAALCLLALFAPSFLLIAGALPFWVRLRQQVRIRSALMGVNAAVVGLLLAALCDPLWSSAILRPADAALALVAFLALHILRTPSWLVVLAGALAGCWIPAPL
ncbi:chromate efflux transporter [Pseudomonas sp. zfem002]|uniref:chromate efflux transporter n=1 Tax=Pseudomonas sp. zfem002 TaxID=3078197 RepID=UPI002927E4A9|nr:chromate efflux transporter [Pseudomonas sp. zfem002]MDU9391281.1 chromate efflux transporter [Pseudomonas sp. zfem002]